MKASVLKVVTILFYTKLFEGVAGWLPLNPIRPLTSCKLMKTNEPDAPSGMYTLQTVNTQKSIVVYCEMGLNGGGYTFLSPEDLPTINQRDLDAIFSDKTTFLLRVRKSDLSQPYAVLKQLSEYENIPLKLGFSSNAGYNESINANIIGKPFLYFAFLSIEKASNRNVQGLMVNGYRNTFKNCDGNPNSHFTLFPNFKEVTPSTYNVPGTFCDQIFANLAPIPSGRVMPPEMYMFGEMHWGGCGCYQQTNQIPKVGGFSIGFR